MKIARAGWSYVGYGAAVAAGGFGLSWGLGLVAAGSLLSFLGLGFSLFSLYFFRDPDRPAPTDPLKIYAPGDGRVLSVAREGPGDTVTLRIFLSPFDVHVQRAPCAGVVEKVLHQPGSFVGAMRDEARSNERVVMTLRSGGREPLAVEQIAGFLARRIQCWPKPGERLVAGQRYGIIHFGSQAAVHFPRGSRCAVSPGQRTVGGVTVIGEWTA